ncbi:MAG: hypothetical protein LC795_02060 [Acidobacteria bacterium]|nr:hypothetical protein [Acidobacteriota bacterium]
MKNSEVRILEMLIRVRQFGRAHADSFPSGSRGAELFTHVGSAVDDLEGLSALQTSHARAAKEKTAQKNAASDVLRAEMEAISRTARSMARATPGLRDKFRLPHNAGEQTWLLTARAFAADAEPLKDEFVRRGMAANFLEGFRSRIGNVEQSIDGRAQKSAARVSATVAVAEAAGRGREAVRELDAVVRNIFRGDASTLAEWESASHLERPARRSSGETPPAGAPSEKS